MSVQIKVTLPDSVLDQAKHCADHRGLTLSEYAKLATVQLIRRDVSAASKGPRTGKTTSDARKSQDCTVSTLPGQI
jgi:hypothetical protein